MKRNGLNISEAIQAHDLLKARKFLKQKLFFEKLSKEATKINAHYSELGEIYNPRIKPLKLRTQLVCDEAWEAMKPRTLSEAAMEFYRRKAREL